MQGKFFDLPTPWVTWVERVGVVLTLAFSMVMIVEPASAQNVTQFTTWATGAQLLGGLIGLGIALYGIIIMFGQHSWVGLAYAIVGGVLVGNAAQVGGFFGGGG